MEVVALPSLSLSAKYQSSWKFSPRIGAPQMPGVGETGAETKGAEFVK